MKLFRSTSKMLWFVAFTLLFLKSFAQRRCNGQIETCPFRFDQATFAGTHNSGAGFNGVLKYSFLNIPAISCLYRNQDKSFTDQLTAGIRFFDIDPCMKGSSVYTCHNTAYGGTMHEVFRQIGEYLKTNRNEVVVIRISDVRSGIDKGKLIQEFKNRFTGAGGNSGLNDYKARTGRFPTINQAIDENKRVFVFMRDDVCDATCRGSNRFILSENTYIADTSHNRAYSSYCGSIVQEMGRQCAAGRDKTFVLVSHFGSYGKCVWDMANNCNPYVIESVKSCAAERLKFGKVVNFIIVDYFDKAPSGKSVVDAAHQQNSATYTRLNLG